MTLKKKMRMEWSSEVQNDIYKHTLDVLHNEFKNSSSLIVPHAIFFFPSVFRGGRATLLEITEWQ